jgi:hypothetical protein
VRQELERRRVDEVLRHLAGEKGLFLHIKGLPAAAASP